MSWLARSLATSLRLDDADDNETGDVSTNPTTNQSSLSRPGDPSPPSPSTADTTSTTAKPQHRRRFEPERIEEEEEEDTQTRGMKEDLSEFKLVLTRQLWGVASFLAPPPPPDEPSPQFDRDRSSEPPDRPDPPPEMAWQEEEEEEAEDEEESFVGVTEEVLAFARNIAMHPETWLDFPLDEEDDLDDFDMSDVQREHVMEIERLAPRLMALRIELCPCHMADGYFWKVYFVLLHSRLSKQDAEALSTPQVMAARAKWMQELQSHTASGSEWFGSGTLCLHEGSDLSHEDHIPLSPPSTANYEDIPLGTFTSEQTTFSFEKDRHPVDSLEFPCIDKSVIVEKPVLKFEDKSMIVHEDDDDDWPEEDFDLDEYHRSSNHVGNEEDISFSDLEDDDFQAPSKEKLASKECQSLIKDR